MDAAAIFEALMSPEGWADPYPLYRRLHEHGPAVALGPGQILVSGYREINEVLRNPAFGITSLDDMAAMDPQSVEQSAWVTLGQSVLQANPPHHKRMRSLMSAVFTPRRVGGLEPAIAHTAERLLDAMDTTTTAGAPVDFMAQFAFALPVTVICELIGIPEADRWQFRDLTRDLTLALDMVSDYAALAPANEADSVLREYFAGLVADRRAEPRDDLVSALIDEVDDASGRLSEAELISNLILLLVAGFETTTNLLGNGLTVLFERPGLAAGLRDGTLACSDFVEEVLRYDSPVQLSSRVPLAEGLEVCGLPVPKGPGADVTLLLGAGNRDPRRFHEPDRFDPLRPDNAPLSFGAGAHFCLGSALARLEANTAFPLLLRRFPDLAPAAAPTRNERFVLRGYQTYPVHVHG